MATWHAPRAVQILLLLAAVLAVVVAVVRRRPPRRAPLRMQCYDGAAQPLHGLGSRLAPGCHGTVAAAGC